MPLASTMVWSQLQMFTRRADGIHGGRAAADLAAGLNHHHVAPGSRQVGGAGQPVVAAADDDDIGAIRRRRSPFGLIMFRS